MEPHWDSIYLNISSYTFIVALSTHPKRLRREASQGRVKVSRLGDCGALRGLLCSLGLLALAQAINRTLG